MRAARAAAIALASDSYLHQRSILSSPIRHATRAYLEGFFIVVFIEFVDRTNRPGLISHQTGVIELIPAPKVSTRRDKLDKSEYAGRQRVRKNKRAPVKIAG